MGNRDSGIVFSFLGFCFLLQYTTSFNPTCNSDDLRALHGFLDGLESQIDGWGRNSSNCCTWEGVVCESFDSVAKDSNMSLRIVSIELGSKRLKGRLSKALAGLRYMRTLNLSANFLSHSLPVQLFQVENLEILDLSSNGFFGFLPNNINLPSLRLLDISKNSLVGTINGDICKTAKGLQVLDLSLNNHHGEIPESLGNCSLLEHLSLSSNVLVGSLPEDLMRLPKLSQLDLQDNKFSGPLSPGFGNLSNLVKFDISYNGFSGAIPNAFQNLENLKQFSAMSNRFIGHLPPSLTNSPSISSLNLNNNSLTGPIVLNCSAMVCLTLLDFGSNQFDGPIPDNMYSCQQLSTLNLARNNLSSQLPSSFKKFKTLSQLSLSNTSLYNLSEALAILQHCRNLTILILTSNFHSEVMPADSNLQFNNLKILAVANCRLTGSVPTWLGGSTKLQLLDLSWNHLRGTIPPILEQLKFLFYLDLSNNSLSGDIPRSLTKLQSLIYRNSSLEYPSQGLKLFLKRDQSQSVLQYNQIGSFPPSLDLSNNMLNGPIWPEFGNLKGLHMLDLSYNNLSGHIPSSLSNMTNLENLDLSYNNLSGSIPSSLLNLNFLSEFRVAYNQLTGIVPSGGQFDSFPDSSFEGNKGLCRALSSSCSADYPEGPERPESESPEEEESIMGLSFGFGAVFGFVITVTIGFVSGWLLPKAETRNGRRRTIKQWR